MSSDLPNFDRTSFTYPVPHSAGLEHDAPMRLAPPHDRRRYVTWRGLGLLLAVCIVNALRRNINSRLLWEDFAEWLVDIRNATITGLIVGALVLFAVIATANLTTGQRRVLRYAGTLAAAALASVAGVMLLLGYDTGWTWVSEPDRFVPYTLVPMFLASWPRYLILAILFALVYMYLRDRHDRERALRDLDADRSLFEQRTAEARVQRLQAQIEPHFLFNTLAHVKRLYQTDARIGRDMLENLMRYLSEALPQMRERHSTVEREVALTKAYLEIHKIRMGQRLDFALDVQRDLSVMALPPMMLLTLVENSIKHGLAPLPQGGTVRVRAARDRDRLLVTVADTGRGFTEDLGHGTGLSNLHSRLTALYGARGQLRFAENTPQGVVATIEVPLHSDPAASAVP
jgi:sensor histidine kinase YesM